VSAPPSHPPKARTTATSSPRERDSATRGPALLFWAQIVGNAGLFVGLLLVTRALGPSGRGAVAFITVTALVTAWIARLGVTEATVVFAAKRPEVRRALLSNSFVFSTAAGLAGAAVAVGAGDLPATG
jgi:O-antigen/teichoic acid export membrane protein